jgi:para-aminobenzoate synthetase component 1
MATRSVGLVDAWARTEAPAESSRFMPVVTPHVRAIPSEWTPLRALAAVEHLPYTLFLESGGPVGAGSEWTILAFDPVWRLELRRGALWRVEGSRANVLEGHPLDALAQEWPEAVTLEPRPAPFSSGLAGYLAYELKDWIERYPGKAAREIDLPDLSLGFYDVVWAWNRGTGEAWCVSTGLPEAVVERREERARERLRAQWRTLESPQARPATAIAPAASPAATRGGSGAPHARGYRPSVTSNFTRDAYLRMVERALDHIAAGDIYQVNLAQRFRVEPAPPLPDLYRSLREASPAPFLAYLSLAYGGIASSSPERFFRIDGERIETWPIKGTRPRGATPTEDVELQGALRASAKDRAENVMIVDLERNDLGRICEIGSIRVPALFEVSSHSNVHHLVSRVEGRMRPGIKPVDVIRALFPGGSITGAPKIRAVEIIDDLEPVQRGVYTGAVGYWDVSGDCDWNIAIRTIVAAGGAASFHAGGGIVADSTPEAEYEETLVKARGMMRALGVSWER